MKIEGGKGSKGLPISQLQLLDSNIEKSSAMILPPSHPTHSFPTNNKLCPEGE